MASWLIKLITSIFSVAILEVIPRWLEKINPSIIKASKPNKREDKIKDKLKKNGWLVVFLIIFLSGCVQVVYLQPGKSVRLRETVKDVKVWVMSKDGQELPAKADLNEGGFYIPYLENEE